MAIVTRNAPCAGIEYWTHAIAPADEAMSGDAPQDQSVFWRVAILPSDERAARVARAIVRAMCAQWGVGGVAEMAAGCVSELAANAIRHVEWSRAPFGQRLVWLVVELWGPLLLVEVRDPSCVLPIVGEQIDFSSLGDAPEDVGLLPESGMGLRLVVDQVEQMGGFFGAVELPGGGKSVYFAVPYGVVR